jgi:hypothetical protein
MSGDERESTGLLSLTVRVQLVASSVDPTHNSCHVECAEARDAAARRTIADFILTASNRRAKRIEKRRYVVRSNELECHNELPTLLPSRSFYMPKNLCRRLSSLSYLLDCSRPGLPWIVIPHPPNWALHITDPPHTASSIQTRSTIRQVCDRDDGWQDCAPQSTEHLIAARRLLICRISRPFGLFVARCTPGYMPQEHPGFPVGFS